MQITNVEVVPIELNLTVPYRVAYGDQVDHAAMVFVRLDISDGRSAWGCAAFDTALTGETLQSVVAACQRCADLALDLNPLNIEYALAQFETLTGDTPSAQCAFDIAFHDLLGLETGLPLYRLFGGFRHRIQTSVTVGIAPVAETVELAHERANQGFRILKIKGGLDPEVDVRRVHAVADALPELALRLDADQGYSVRQALDVARAVAGKVEMLEQPTHAGSLEALCQVAEHSPVPILASQSVSDPAAALEIANRRCVSGISIKLVTCGGMTRARQLDAIARAGRMSTMVGCLNEPALLIAAGLAFALSSPNVQYGDLDGHFDLVDDPTVPGFCFEDGWLVATDVPGLGCTVEL
ncbi:MAG: dipeptide epimerase [Chloroflexota bacterium]|nr:dipeptide epimerase [Chloroflexota bacterium]